MPFESDSQRYAMLSHLNQTANIGQWTYGRVNINTTTPTPLSQHRRGIKHGKAFSISSQQKNGNKIPINPSVIAA
jgi:hypothetical protein